MTDRPEFSHKKERHGVIGPFSGRQLVFAFAAVIALAVILRRHHDAAGHDRQRPRRRRPARDRLHPVVAAAGRPQGRRHRPRIRGGRRRRHDLPAQRPRRQPDQPRRPQGQGRLGQLLDDLVPALPVRGADPARPRRALQGPRPRGRRDQRPGDLAGRRQGLRDEVPAPLHHRLRRLGQDLPRVQGVRAADPGVHRCRTASSVRSSVRRSTWPARPPRSRRSCRRAERGGTRIWNGRRHLQAAWITLP